MEDALRNARSLQEGMSELKAKLKATVCLLSSMEPQLASLAKSFHQIGGLFQDLQGQFAKFQHQVDDVACGALPHCHVGCTSPSIIASDSTATGHEGEATQADEASAEGEVQVDGTSSSTAASDGAATSHDGDAMPADGASADGELQVDCASLPTAASDSIATSHDGEATPADGPSEDDELQVGGAWPSATASDDAANSHDREATPAHGAGAEGEELVDDASPSTAANDGSATSHDGEATPADGASEGGELQVDCASPPIAASDGATTSHDGETMPADGPSEDDELQVGGALPSSAASDGAANSHDREASPAQGAGAEGEVQVDGASLSTAASDGAVTSHDGEATPADGASEGGGLQVNCSSPPTAARDSAATSHDGEATPVDGASAEDEVQVDCATVTSHNGEEMPADGASEDGELQVDGTSPPTTAGDGVATSHDGVATLAHRVSAQGNVQVDGTSPSTAASWLIVAPPDGASAEGEGQVDGASPSTVASDGAATNHDEEPSTAASDGATTSHDGEAAPADGASVDGQVQVDCAAATSHDEEEMPAYGASAEGVVQEAGVRNDGIVALLGPARSLLADREAALQERCSVEHRNREASPRGTQREDAAAPEAGPQTAFERLLSRQSHGLYEPLAMRSRRRVPEGRGSWAVKGRLSVAVPTMGSRHGFHERIWRIFDAQTWPDKELIVVETFSTTSSPFFAAKAQEDERIVYVSLNVDEGRDLSIGLKRNICTHLASGELIANFDDDDLYAPEYLATMVEAMRVKKADAITLSGWYVVDARTGTVGYTDPKAICHRENVSAIDGWTFGYGFSYVYSRAAALRSPYPDVSMNEDWSFYQAIREENHLRMCRQGLELLPMEPAGVALLFDSLGICLHTLHGASTSECWAHREVPCDEAQALALQSLGDIFAAQLRCREGPIAPSRFIPGPPRDRLRLLRIASRGDDFRVVIRAGARVGEIRPEVEKGLAWNSPSGRRLRLFRAPLIDGKQQPEGPPLQDHEIVPLRCNLLWAAGADEGRGEVVKVKVVDMLDLTLSMSVEVSGAHATVQMVKDRILGEVGDGCSAERVAAAAKVKLAKLTIGRRFVALNPSAPLGDDTVLFATGLAEALGKARKQEDGDRALHLNALFFEIFGC